MKAALLAVLAIGPAPNICLGLVLPAGRLRFLDPRPARGSEVAK